MFKGMLFLNEVNHFGFLFFKMHFGTKILLILNLCGAKVKKKSRKNVKFGVEKVIWITSKETQTRNRFLAVKHVSNSTDKVSKGS